jgi:hypothetical protein
MQGEVFMARVWVGTLFIAALLSFTGCSALFEFNAFSSLDKPAPPKLSDFQGSGGLARLAADLASAAVIAQFKADPATTKLVEDYLATYLPPVDSDGQTAAALYADLNLKTTSGDQLVKNAVATLTTQSSWSGDIKAILGEIIPADVIHDQAAFEAMVGGLVNARTAYALLGATLAPPGVPPQGMNMGDIAQKAVVAYLMDAVVSAVVTQTPPGSLTQKDAADQLYYLVNDQSNDITTYGETATDPFNPLPPDLKYILDAAKLPYPG